MKKMPMWKVAVLVSSVALATGFVAYAVWSYAPEDPGATPATPEAGPAAPGPAAEEPRVFFPGSKGAIGIGGGPGGLYQGPGAADAPPKPPDERELHFGGSKSMPLPPPPADGPSK